jgi:hypothetical protein
VAALTVESCHYLCRRQRRDDEHDENEASKVHPSNSLLLADRSDYGVSGRQETTFSHTSIRSPLRCGLS